MQYVLYREGSIIRKGEKTKQHVIEQTSLLLNRRGYLSTTLSEITDATGLQKGGLYNHFRDKEELSLASFRHNCAALGEYVYRAAEEAGPNAVDRLLAYLTAYCRVDYPGGCPIANMASETRFVSEPLFLQAKEAMDDVLRFTEETIRTGIANREIRPEVDARDASLFIFSMVEGAILMHKLYPDAISMLLERITRYVNAELRLQVLS
ncbi:TetR/AcrR family transcriptional regulator [Paenibacillus glycinis]|uniref:TetR family transcriptional regulator n=1 Tax=Paenibacillus glycinis TaxID=2697035 RepID=A0ABW9XKS3_9BACL|nr:TetR/AcrR family transcriptional regulator [Paenibacillus glycinis]NBD23205.1 TetR family transcriptional regulator [Paenibacillus glycinis]